MTMPPDPPKSLLTPRDSLFAHKRIVERPLLTPSSGVLAGPRLTDRTLAWSSPMMASHKPVPTHFSEAHESVRHNLPGPTEPVVGPPPVTYGERKPHSLRPRGGVKRRLKAPTGSLTPFVDLPTPTTRTTPPPAPPLPTDAPMGGTSTRRPLPPVPKGKAPSPKLGGQSHKLRASSVRTPTESRTLSSFAPQRRPKPSPQDTTVVKATPKPTGTPRPLPEPPRRGTPTGPPDTTPTAKPPPAPPKGPARPPSRRPQGTKGATPPPVPERTIVSKPPKGTAPRPRRPLPEVPGPVSPKATKAPPLPPRPTPHIPRPPSKVVPPPPPRSTQGPLSKKVHGALGAPSLSMRPPPVTTLGPPTSAPESDVDGARQDMTEVRIRRAENELERRLGHEVSLTKGLGKLAPSGLSKPGKNTGKPVQITAQQERALVEHMLRTEGPPPVPPKPGRTPPPVPPRPGKAPPPPPKTAASRRQASGTKGPPPPLPPKPGRTIKPGADSGQVGTTKPETTKPTARMSSKERVRTKVQHDSTSVNRAQSLLRREKIDPSAPDESISRHNDPAVREAMIVVLEDRNYRSGLSGREERILEELYDEQGGGAGAQRVVWTAKKDKKLKALRAKAHPSSADRRERDNLEREARAAKVQVEDDDVGDRLALLQAKPTLTPKEHRELVDLLERDKKDKEGDKSEAHKKQAGLLAAKALKAWDPEVPVLERPTKYALTERFAKALRLKELRGLRSPTPSDLRERHALEAEVRADAEDDDAPIPLLDAMLGRGGQGSLTPPRSAKLTSIQRMPVLTAMGAAGLTALPDLADLGSTPTRAKGKQGTGQPPVGTPSSSAPIPTSPPPDPGASGAIPLAPGTPPPLPPKPRKRGGSLRPSRTGFGSLAPSPGSPSFGGSHGSPLTPRGQQMLVVGGPPSSGSTSHGVRPSVGGTRGPHGSSPGGSSSPHHAPGTPGGTRGPRRGRSASAPHMMRSDAPHIHLGASPTGTSGSAPQTAPDGTPLSDTASGRAGSRRFRLKGAAKAFKQKLSRLRGSSPKGSQRGSSPRSGMGSDSPSDTQTYVHPRAKHLAEAMRGPVQRGQHSAAPRERGTSGVERMGELEMLELLEAIATREGDGAVLFRRIGELLDDRERLRRMREM